MGAHPMTRFWILFVLCGCGAAAKVSSSSCPHDLAVVVADIHDGDQKLVTIHSGTMTVSPHANNETWKVTATINPTSCSASVDFNVPGKPNPPPVNLTATFSWSVLAADPRAIPKALFTYTDPTGTLGPPSHPLNVWLQMDGDEAEMLSGGARTSRLPMGEVEERMGACLLEKMPALNGPAMTDCARVVVGESAESSCALKCSLEAIGVYWACTAVCIEKAAPNSCITAGCVAATTAFDVPCLAACNHSNVA